MLTVAFSLGLVLGGIIGFSAASLRCDFKTTILRQEIAELKQRIMRKRL